MSLNIPGHGVGFHWGAIGGIIEGLIGNQEILSIREKTQTQAREFNDFNAHRARDSINTEQELHWNNAAASLNGNAFIIPSKNREQQNNALKKMKTKTSLSIINILHCYVFTINCVHKTIRRGHQSKAPVHVAGLCAVTCSLWTYRMCGLLLKMSTYQMTLGSLCQAPMRFLGVEKHTHTDGDALRFRVLPPALHMIWKLSQRRDRNVQRSDYISGWSKPRCLHNVFISHCGCLRDPHPLHQRNPMDRRKGKYIQRICSRSGPECTVVLPHSHVFKRWEKSAPNMNPLK